MPNSLGASIDYMGSEPQLRSRTLSFSERLQGWIQGTLFSDDREGYDRAGQVNQLLQTAIPPLGAASSAYDMGRSAAEDHPLDAAGSALAIFGGPGAKTADRAMLASATRMERSGLSRNEIWSKTGWFKGADGAWRFEIPDSGAKYTLGEAQNVAQPKARDILDHPAAYAAYPELGDIPVGGFRAAPDARGYLQYSAENPRVMQMGLNEAHLDDPEATTSTILHELQHGVQNLEGFAPGGFPPDIMDPRVQRLIGDKSAQIVKSPPSYEDFLDIIGAGDNQLSKLLYKQTLNAIPSGKLPEAVHFKLADMASHEVYARGAGEVEARNVQTRWQDWSDTGGGDFPYGLPHQPGVAPWLSQDVPTAMQFVTPGVK